MNMARDFVDSNLDTLAQLYGQNEDEAIRMAHNRGGELAAASRDTGATFL